MTRSAGATAKTKIHPAKQWWAPIVEFGVHSVAGTVIFAIIFTPAVLLNLGMQNLEEKHKISTWLVNSCLVGEVLLVVADLTLYAIFLWKTGCRAAKEF